MIHAVSKMEDKNGIQKNTSRFHSKSTKIYTHNDFIKWLPNQLVSHAPTNPFIPYESLSTLLYYTYGFSRHDEGEGASWPFHRFVASARCLFPTELYLWLPQTEH